MNWTNLETYILLNAFQILHYILYIMWVWTDTAVNWRHTNPLSRFYSSAWGAVTVYFLSAAYTVTWWSTWMLRLFSRPSVMSTWPWTGYAPPSSTSEPWRTPHTTVRAQNTNTETSSVSVSVSWLHVNKNLSVPLLQFQVSQPTWTDMESKQNCKVGHTGFLLYLKSLK